MLIFAILAALAVFPAVSDKKLAISAAIFSILIFASLPYVGENGLYYKTEMFWSACIAFEAVMAALFLFFRHTAGFVIIACCLLNILANAAGNLIWIESGGKQVLDSYYSVILTSDIIKALMLFAFSPPAIKLFERIIYGKPDDKDQMTWMPKQSTSY